MNERLDFLRRHLTLPGPVPWVCLIQYHDQNNPTFGVIDHLVSS